MQKRFVALLLSLLLLLLLCGCEENGAAPPPATPTTDENTDYVHDGGSFGECFSYQLYASGRLVINTSSETPVALPDLETKADQPWTAYRSMITSLTLEDGITHLSAHALEGCTNLTEVSLPASLTSLGEAAFLGCTRLESILLPATVGTVPFECFKECTRLQRVTARGVTLISENAFMNCQKLGALYLSAALAKVEAYAFSGAATGGTLFVYLPAPATAWATCREGIHASGNDALLGATVHEE